MKQNLVDLLSLRLNIRLFFVIVVARMFQWIWQVPQTGVRDSSYSQIKTTPLILWNSETNLLHPAGQNWYTLEELQLSEWVSEQMSEWASVRASEEVNEDGGGGVCVCVWWAMGAGWVERWVK